MFLLYDLGGKKAQSEHYGEFLEMYYLCGLSGLAVTAAAIVRPIMTLGARCVVQLNIRRA